MRFDEDIIITDPCYLFRKDLDSSVWYKCIDSLSIEGVHCLIHNTGTGDMTGGVFCGKNLDVQIGLFGVDAGLFGVFSVKDLEAWDGFAGWSELQGWLYTRINKFHGDIEVIKEFNSLDEAHDSFWLNQYMIKATGYLGNHPEDGESVWVARRTGL